MIELGFIFLIMGALLTLLQFFSSVNIAESVLKVANFSNQMVAIVIMISLFEGKEAYLDIAAIILLFGFVAVFAIYKYYEKEG